MPLILNKHIEKGEIGLWEISEEVDELLILAKLATPDIITYSGISALHRKKEWLATRALLNELTGESYLIHYHNDGRPYLKNTRFNISISHSNGFVAILLHSLFIPGIDIELLNRQVGKVASRFLSAEELAACNEKAELSNHLKLLHWCGKEAIFKMIALTNIEFSTDILIQINDLDENNGSFSGIFNDKSSQIPIPLYFMEKCGILLVWGWVKALNADF
ncbi:MAG: 4'-phosphopantetheinyl transferase superfamily protein [Mariniphaga sp.]